MVGIAAKKRTKIRNSKQDQIFDFVIVAILTFWLLVVLYPLVQVISSSFSSPLAVVSGRVTFLPVDFTLDGYKAVFSSRNIWIGYFNVFFYTVVGTIVNVLMTIAAAYPLSRNDFKGRNVFTFIFAFTMMFSGGLIPTYIVVQKLKMLDTRMSMIIPMAMTVWNVVITRTFFQKSIPNELWESAQMDGCGNITFLLMVVVPLSGAILAVISLYYAVDHWNDYFTAIIYLRNKALFPLQVFLREILIQNSADATMTDSAGSDMDKRFLSELLKYSLIVVASVPLMVAYPFAQKYFVKGVLIGSIKG